MSDYGRGAGRGRPDRREEFAFLLVSSFFLAQPIVKPKPVPSIVAACPQIGNFPARQAQTEQLLNLARLGGTLF